MSQPFNLNNSNNANPSVSPPPPDWAKTDAADSYTIPSNDAPQGLPPAMDMVADTGFEPVDPYSNTNSSPQDVNNYPSQDLSNTFDSSTLGMPGTNDQIAQPFQESIAQPDFNQYQNLPEVNAMPQDFNTGLEQPALDQNQMIDSSVPPVENFGDTLPPFEPQSINAPETFPGGSDTGDVPPPPNFSQDPPSPPSNNNGLTPASFEGSKSPIKKFVIIALVVVMLISGILIAVRMFTSNDSGKTGSGDSSSKEKTSKDVKEVNLTYWGLWELNNTLEDVIKDFEKDNPGVTITYKKQSHKDYRERLQSEIAAGTGPDIFRIHNTWVPMMTSELEPDPAGYVDLKDYYPVVEKDLSFSGKTYGVPLMFDALALYYNPSMLQKAGVSVPTTWEALRSAAAKIRVPQALDEPIQTSGVALGTANNVDHFADIIGLLLLQNGADPKKPDECSTTNNPKTGKPDCWGQDSFLFYDLFRSDGIWDETLPSSTYAFATEKVAMMFAPSWRAFEIAEINPDLKFLTAPVPQLTNEKIGWATYWVESVSKKSKNVDMAWKFLAYLSKEESLIKLYTAQSNTRMFGEIYPRKSMASMLKNEDVVGAFVEQGDYAKSWYLSSFTHDNGINDQIIKYYEDAVNEISAKEKPTDILPTVTSGVAQVYKKYGLSSK